MASSKRTAKPALTFKASAQLLIWALSHKRPWYKCINSHAALPSRKPLSSDLSYVETTPYPDLTFETCSGMAVLFGNLCTCSQFIPAVPHREPQPPSLPRDDERRTCTACAPPRTPSLGCLGTPVLPACPALHLYRQIISSQTPSPTFHGINCQTALILSAYGAQLHTKATYLIFNRRPT